MRAANADAVFIHSGNRTEQLGALKGRHTACLRGNKFRVVGEQRRGVNHHFGVADIFRTLAHRNGNAERTNPRERVAFVVVRTRKFIAPAVQNFRKRTHTASADADEVDAFHFFQ